MLVGHSTGGGEVTRYIGRHGTSRLAKAVLVGAVPPLMLKTESNPDAPFPKQGILLLWPSMRCQQISKERDDD